MIRYNPLQWIRNWWNNRKRVVIGVDCAEGESVEVWAMIKGHTNKDGRYFMVDSIEYLDDYLTGPSAASDQSE